MLCGDDMEWSTIKKELYFEDGSLRDIITDTDDMSLVKWKQLCDFLKINYELRVFCDGEEMEGKFDYSLIEKILLDKEHCYIATFRVCEIAFNLHFSFGSQHLEFDFFPNEVDSLDKHMAIWDFMSQLANILQINVKLTGENCHNGDLLKVVPTTV